MHRSPPPRAPIPRYAPAMRYLVTGASGFVGGAVIRRILAAGDEVHGTVRPGAAAAPTVVTPGLRLFPADLGDPNAIATAAEGCEVVIHTAGISVPNTARQTLEWTHMAGTENVLNAARHAGVARVVLISTAEVTLRTEQRVYWDEDRAIPRTPHGAFARTKLVAEEMALAASTPALQVVALRPAWLWGAGDTSRLPLLAREALTGGIRLVGDGDNLFDTTHVETLVDAVMDASEETRAAGRCYYITDGAMESAREFFERMSRALAVPTPRDGQVFPLAYAAAWMRERQQRPGLITDDVLLRGVSSQFNNQRARTELAWEPREDRDALVAALAQWVQACGGVEVLAKGRPPWDPATAAASVGSP